VRLSMTKSNDSSYHVYKVMSSRGNSRQTATALAERLVFEPVQHDSVLVLPRGFLISRNDKFRNQGVWVVIEVPAGKKIKFSNDISGYHWFNTRNDNDWNNSDDSWDEVWNNLHRPSPGQEYIMNVDGKPERVNKQPE
jgi:hypothetical protein